MSSNIGNKRSPISSSRGKEESRGKRSRKRARADQTAGASETIEIHGVPPTLTPVLIQALKDSTKFFQKQQTAVLPPEQVTETNCIPLSKRNETNSDGVLEGILSRATSSALTDEQDKRQARMEEGTQAFFQAIKRVIGDRQSQDPQPRKGCQSSQPPVPVACLVYVCELSQTHGRIAVRRAALRFCGVLLQKSRECRFHLCDGNELLDWMKTVVDAPSFSWKNGVQAASSQVILFQKECLAWMTNLCETFSKHYPKLKVARIFLEQRCPMLNVKSEDDTNVEFGCNNLPQLRLLRDAALKYGTTECQRVQRLVSRAQAYLDALVPRFGDNVDSGHDTSKENGSDDDSVDIDWEDGDVEEEHAVAVERTLAVMESTGGFLSGGALEINFDSELETCRQDHVDEKSLEALKKCVRLLSQRHMPRLNAWMNALTRADSLKPSSTDSTSLLLLPVEISQTRAPMLQLLLDAKASISTVLSSAARLSVEAPSIPEKSTPLEPMPRVLQPMSASRNRQFPSQKRGISFSRQRSNRVQIKYRKN